MAARRISLYRVRLMALTTSFRPRLIAVMTLPNYLMVTQGSTEAQSSAEKVHTRLDACEKTGQSDLFRKITD